MCTARPFRRDLKPTGAEAFSQRWSSPSSAATPPTTVKLPHCFPISSSTSFRRLQSPCGRGGGWWGGGLPRRDVNSEGSPISCAQAGCRERAFLARLMFVCFPSAESPNPNGPRMIGEFPMNGPRDSDSVATSCYGSPHVSLLNHATRYGLNHGRRLPFASKKRRISRTIPNHRNSCSEVGG